MAETSGRRRGGVWGGGWEGVLGVRAAPGAIWSAPDNKTAASSLKCGAASASAAEAVHRAALSNAFLNMTIPTLPPSLPPLPLLRLLCAASSLRSVEARRDTLLAAQRSGSVIKTAVSGGLGVIGIVNVESS